MSMTEPNLKPTFQNMPKKILETSAEWYDTRYSKLRIANDTSLKVVQILLKTFKDQHMHDDMTRFGIRRNISIVSGLIEITKSQH